MSVEHRWSERKPIQMDVTLFYEPMGTILGRTRNISLEGMFVQTNGIKLPLNARLEVSFVSRSHGKEKEHHVPAYVVHDHGDGVGLMLRHSDYSDFYALRHMLTAA